MKGRFARSLLSLFVVLVASCAHLQTARPLPRGVVELQAEFEQRSHSVILVFDDSEDAPLGPLPHLRLWFSRYAGVTIMPYHEVLNIARREQIRANELDELAGRLELARRVDAALVAVMSDNGLQLIEPGTERRRAYVPSSQMRRPTRTGRNHALKTRVSASSVRGDGRAELMVDGEPTTRWESTYDDPQEFVIDLGQKVELDTIIIQWEFARAEEYWLDVSSDGTTWRPIYHLTHGDPYASYRNGDGRDEVLLVSGQGRYLRYRGISRTTVWGHSIFELEVYGRGTGPALTVVLPDASLKTGTRYEFAAEVSTEGQGTEFAWRIDGARGSGNVISHEFARPGIYELTVVATDAHGATTQVYRELLVQDAAEPVVSESEFRDRMAMREYYQSISLSPGERWESDNPYGTALYDNVLYNNLAWNGQDPGYGAQTIWVEASDPIQWGVAADHTLQGMVKSFPNAQIGWHYGLWSPDSPLPVKVSDVNELTVSWEFEVPPTGSYNAIIQLYVSPNAEGGPEGDILIGLHHRNWPLSENDNFVGYVELAGRTWFHSVNKRSEVAEHMVFYLPEPVTSVSDLAVHEILKFCVNQGYISDDEFLVTLEHGWELIRVDGSFRTTAFDYTLR